MFSTYITPEVHVVDQPPATRAVSAKGLEMMSYGARAEPSRRQGRTLGYAILDGPARSVLPRSGRQYSRGAREVRSSADKIRTAARPLAMSSLSIQKWIRGTSTNRFAYSFLNRREHVRMKASPLPFRPCSAEHTRSAPANLASRPRLSGRAIHSHLNDFTPGHGPLAPSTRSTTRDFVNASRYYAPGCPAWSRTCKPGATARQRRSVCPQGGNGVDAADQEQRMKPPRCACGKEAVVVMNDVWLCLEDFQVRLEQQCNALKQARDILRGARNA